SGRKRDHDLTQAALRGGAAIAGYCRGAIARERVLVTSQALIKAANQYIDDWLKCRRYADRLEFIGYPGGIVEIADLDGRAKCLFHRHPLQLDRQRTNGGGDGLENVARL